MNHSLVLAALTLGLLVPTAGCGDVTANPIGQGGGSSSSTSSETGSGGSSSSTSSETGSGGESGGACAPGCGSGEVCVASSCHALATLDTAITVNEGGCVIVVDDTNVYWRSGEVRRAPKAGGASTLLDFGLSSPGGLVVDDKYLYWTSLVVYRAEKDAPAAQGTSAGIFYADEGGNPTRMVGDGSTLFYLDTGMVLMTPTSSPPNPSATPETLSPAWSLLDTPIAVDATNVYLWTEAGSVLTKVNKATKAATDIGNKGNGKVDETSTLIADESGVYYSKSPVPGAGGVVAKVGGPGQQATILVDEAAGGSGVFTVDADSLYYMTAAGVMAMPKTGGAAVMLAPLDPPSPFPTCMAVDDTHVYWVDGKRLMQYRK